MLPSCDVETVGVDCSRSCVKLHRHGPGRDYGVSLLNMAAVRHRSQNDRCRLVSLDIAVFELAAKSYAKPHRPAKVVVIGAHPLRARMVHVRGSVEIVEPSPDCLLYRAAQELRRLQHHLHDVLVDVFLGADFGRVVRDEDVH